MARKKSCESFRDILYPLLDLYRFPYRRGIGGGGGSTHKEILMGVIVK